MLQIVNTRAGLLGATRVIDDIALDKYTFIRDAYLQRRRSLVFDGDAPETPAAPEAQPPPRRGGRAAGTGRRGAAAPARRRHPRRSAAPGLGAAVIAPARSACEPRSPVARYRGEPTRFSEQGS